MAASLDPVVAPIIPHVPLSDPETMTLQSAHACLAASARSLSGLAPAVVCTAWFDPLRDEDKAYADALRAADIPTTHHEGFGLIHG